MFLGGLKIGSSEAMESEPNERQEAEGIVTKLRAKKEIIRQFSFFFFFIDRLRNLLRFIGQRWIRNILARTGEIARSKLSARKDRNTLREII